MSVKSLYEALDIDYMLQTVTFNYPGSKTYTQYDVDSNKFDVLIEYLGQTCRLKFDVYEVAHRSGIEGIMSKVIVELENIFKKFGGKYMSAKQLYGRFDVIDLLQDIMSDYPGSKIFGHFEPDPNDFRVHIEYLGETDNLKIDASMLGYRDFIAEVRLAVTDALEKMKLGEENTTDSMFKRLFDICKTYDVSVNIRPMTINHNICRIRVLKDDQALDYLIDLDEISQSKMPMDGAFITRIGMAAKELSNDIHGFDLGSVSELTIKEENVT